MTHLSPQSSSPPSPPSSPSTTMTPRILAQASLPSICSYSSSNSEPPEFTITLTLLASQTPIKIHKRISPFRPLMNVIRIRNVQTLETVWMPRMDVYRRRPYEASDMTPENYWTLEPDVPFVMIKLDFRPYGDLVLKKIAKGNFERELGRERWRIFVTLGLHLLEPGKEYLIGIHEGLHIFEWEVGTNMMDDDDSEKGDRNGEVAEGRHSVAERKSQIPVDVAEGCRFRVED